MTDDHPEIPVSEWDGRHIAWETETCRHCGSDIHYVGGFYPGYGLEGHIKCEDSGETLFQA